MKPKTSFPGELRAMASELWKEHKFIIIALAIGLSFLLTAIISYAQTPAAREKTTGIPQGTISPVVNYDRGTLKLSDFKDKLLILDFWATYCAPCRLLLPHYDGLQRQLADKIQILLVTHEKREAPATFLKQHHYMLPSVTDDAELARAFPHNGIPYEVWIYRGKVIAATDGDQVTAEKINSILRGESGNAPVPKVTARFDEDQPLLLNGNGWNPGEGKLKAAPISYQSLITPYNPGLNSIAGIHRTPEHINIFALNATPLSLYHLAVKESDPLLDVSNRYIIELPDSLKESMGANLSGITPKSWSEKYALCYNLYLPANFKAALGPYILSDLNRFFANYFGIEASIERRNVTCLVLSRLPESPEAKLHGKQTDRAASRAPEYRSDTGATIIRGLPLSELLLPLAYTYRRLPTPLVDETGYTGPVNIELDGNIADRAQLDRALHANGLQLIEAVRTIPMVVIRESGAAGVYPSTTSTHKP